MVRFLGSLGNKRRQHLRMNRGSLFLNQKQVGVSSRIESITVFLETVLVNLRDLLTFFPKLLRLARFSVFDSPCELFQGELSRKKASGEQCSPEA
jgi:hypothetical protein